VQSQAAAVIGLTDDEYKKAGATIVSSAADVFGESELIVKVKEPQASELDLLEARHTLFTYLHLAPAPDLTHQLQAIGCTAIAYETVTERDGGLPLLAPMSEVAGRMSVQAGAHCLEIEQGGRGILLGGVPGTLPAQVVVLGGGVVGTNAVRVALGMEADVTVVDISHNKLAELDTHYGPALNTLFSSVDAVEEIVREADLIIGAVLVAGGAAPKLVPESLVKEMKTGAVIVDVAIDQGGCIATSRPTTHAEPTFTQHGVVHYCVANMPGAVARTSTFALNNATLPFILALANKGTRQALADDPHLRNGLNIYNGQITYAAVAEATGNGYKSADEMLGL
jgi:alanine dehydrogenase